MTRLIDRELFTERSASVLAHLDRVAAHLPEDADHLRPMSSVTTRWCCTSGRPSRSSSTSRRPPLSGSVSVSPATYADAFRLLADAGVLDEGLAERLGRAAGVRDLLDHASARLHLRRVHVIALDGPADLRAFWPPSVTAFDQRHVEFRPRRDPG